MDVMEHVEVNTMNKQEIQQSLSLDWFKPTNPKDDITVMTNLQGFEGMEPNEVLQEVYVEWKEGVIYQRSTLKI